MARMEVKLARPDRIYRPPDIVDGTVVITSPSSFSHQGIRLTALGSVIIQPSSRAVGVIESLYSSVKPSVLMKKVVEISAAGKLAVGKTEFSFHVSLDVPKNAAGQPTIGFFYETYHGAYISIQYLVTTEVVRGYLQKPLIASVEFIIEGCRGRVARFPAEFVNFYITQDTQKHLLLPAIRSGGFKVVGRVITQCSLSEPVTGELTVEHSAIPIRSIDIHLFRVETILLSEKMATERTEVQITQVADGDVCRGLPLPIYIILPRLLTCPTLSANSFSVEFELSIMITFEAASLKHYPEHEPKQSVAFESLPLRLLRV